MDSSAIYNLFNEQAGEPEVYADAQWGYLQDNNNGVYTNSIKFVTNTLKPQLVDYHNAAITIPFTLSSSNGSAYTGVENVAFKQSVYDLIESLLVTTDQSQTIVNEQRTNYINNLRLALERNTDWDIMEGPSIDHCIDQWISGDYSGPQGTNASAAHASNVVQYITNDPTEFTTVATTPPALGPRNPNYNKGFDRRIKIFKSTLYPAGTSTAGTGGAPVVNGFSSAAYTYLAIIPLKHLHDFFMQLDFPVFNLGFTITLYLNQTSALAGSGSVVSNSGYLPFMTDNNSVNTTSGSKAVSPPVFTVNGGGANLGCRLYYRSVKLEPRENKRLAEMLATGFTKSIKFISTDYIAPVGAVAAAPTAGSTTTFNQVISTSTVQPLRIWMLGYPQGVLARSDYASGVVPVQWSDANVLVNNFPYFSQNINSGNNRPEDWWELFKEQCDPQLGSMVSYDQFVNAMNYCCFDVSRLSDRLQSPTQAVTLAVKANRQDKGTTPAEVTILIERMNEISIRFSNNGINIVVGNITGR